ncbi:MAG: transposase, partial [Clostridia bacterium]|nr:transposase [Clostridia bacterium]
KDWLVLVSTDMSLSEDEIIRLYSRRWEIETFFKVCKQYLRLTSECHSLSYDALTAHLCIVLCRYIMLVIEQRCCADQRTLGELFRYAVYELRDITLAEALLYLMEQFAACFEAAKDGNTDVVSDLLDDFVSKLPKGVQHMLKCMERQSA